MVASPRRRWHRRRWRWSRGRRHRLISSNCAVVHSLRHGQHEAPMTQERLADRVGGSPLLDGRSLFLFQPHRLQWRVRGPPWARGVAGTGRRVCVWSSTASNNTNGIFCNKSHQTPDPSSPRKSSRPRTPSQRGHPHPASWVLAGGERHAPKHLPASTFCRNGLSQNHDGPGRRVGPGGWGEGGVVLGLARGASGRAREAWPGQDLGPARVPGRTRGCGPDQGVFWA